MKWSEEICQSIGLKEKYLPKMVESDTICGYLSGRAAREVGLKSGIPLVSGAGDRVAGCLGAANVEAGDIVFEASSYGEISCCVEEYRPDMQEERLDVLAAAVPGKILRHTFYCRIRYYPGLVCESFCQKKRSH